MSGSCTICHLLLQFLAKKNEENRANMEAVMSGPKEDVLTRMLRGLSGAKVTKQGKFMAFDESPFLACNYKNDAGAGHTVCLSCRLTAISIHSVTGMARTDLFAVPDMVLGRQRAGLPCGHPSTAPAKLAGTLQR